MQLIKPCCEVITEKDPIKKIEIAGRTCYKSENNITDNSAIKFFDALVKSNHAAMLEHATFVFLVNKKSYEEACRCKFLNATYNEQKNRYLISGNLRAINESNLPILLDCLCRESTYSMRLCYADNAASKSWSNCDNNGQEAHLIDLDDLADATFEEISTHKYTTMRFTTDRGVTHELVRHRLFSFAQESTRYCCYNSDKHGGGNIKFIMPAGFDSWYDEDKEAFKAAMQRSEDEYNRMIQRGFTAQQARAVLPNALKTEIVVTGNDAEWQHFFDLRCKGTTGKPHPDMKVIADMAFELYFRPRG